MNILLIGKFYEESFGLHISETLVLMGHNTNNYTPGYKETNFFGIVGKRLNQLFYSLYSLSDNITTFRKLHIKKLFRVVKKGNFDVILVCHDFLRPEEVDLLRNYSNSKIALWFPDSMINFGKAFFMNANYDALFFKDPYIIYSLSDVLKTPIYYLPECYNPNRHRLSNNKLRNTQFYECDITTAGNLHSWRIAFFNNLTKYKVKLWGNPPPLWARNLPIINMHQGKAVYNSEKAIAFLSSKIVINNLHFSEGWGVNVRCFESAGIGAFQMIDWRPGLDHLFTDGEEIITFKNMLDLKEKIDYWLPRDEERKKIGLSAKARAAKEHTYELRLQLLLDTLYKKADGFPIPKISQI